MLGKIRYHVSPDAAVQYMGGEIVTLLAALVLMASAFFERSAIATLLGAGAGLYIVYTMVTVTFGQDYNRYDGNAERWFLLFVMITAATIPVTARKISLLLRAPTPEVGWLQRGTLIVFAVMFATLWLSAILKDAGHSSEYLADPTLFWLIKFLDLAVVIPACLICASQWSGSYLTTGIVALAFSFWMLLAISGMQIATTASTHAGMDSLIVALVFGIAALWTGFCVWLASRNWELVGQQIR